jgi:hypothetical protein
MGYTTDFSGKFNLNKPLSGFHINYLRKFARTRRMKRDAVLTAKLDDAVRRAVVLHGRAAEAARLSGRQSRNRRTSQLRLPSDFTCSPSSRRSPRQATTRP